MSDTLIVFHQFTALAAHHIDEAVARAEADPDLLRLRSGLEETPLHFLAVENHLGAVARLIAAGASVDVVNFCGSSPLLETTTLGYIAMCRLLLEHGADPSVKNNVGVTALSAAAMRNHAELFTLLLPYCTRDINDYFNDLDAEELQGRTGNRIRVRCSELGLRVSAEHGDVTL